MPEPKGTAKLVGEVVPGEYQDDPKLTRKSVRRLLVLPFRVLCPNHGAPVTIGAKKAIRRALAQDAAKTG